MKTQVTHRLSPTWAQHFQEVLSQVTQFENEALILDGQAAAKRKEADFMKRHLSVLIGQIEKADKLPPSLKPYALSQDGSTLIGEVEVQQEKPNVMDNSAV
jgi:hypothetical protein